MNWEEVPYNQGHMREKQHNLTFNVKRVGFYCKSKNIEYIYNDFFCCVARAKV